MTEYVNLSGTWREIDKQWVNVSGTWREVDKKWVNVGGTWRESYSGSIAMMYITRVATPWPNDNFTGYNIDGQPYCGSLTPDTIPTSHGNKRIMGIYYAYRSKITKILVAGGKVGSAVTVNLDGTTHKFPYETVVSGVAHYFSQGDPFGLYSKNGQTIPLISVTFS